MVVKKKKPKSNKNRHHKHGNEITQDCIMNASIYWGHSTKISTLFFYVSFSVKTSVRSSIPLPFQEWKKNWVFKHAIDRQHLKIHIINLTVSKFSTLFFPRSLALYGQLNKSYELHENVAYYKPGLLNHDKDY